MPKKYDVVAITGTYQKDGQDKPKYENAGVIIEKDGKFHLKINKAVIFHDDGHVIQWFSLYAPRQQTQQPQQNRQRQAPPQQGPADFDDDIPF